MAGLDSKLQFFYKKYALLDAKTIKKSRIYVTKLMLMIYSRLKQEFKAIGIDSKKPVLSGSVAEGTKCFAVDEFDFMFPIVGPLLDFEFVMLPQDLQDRHFVAYECSNYNDVTPNKLKTIIRSVVKNIMNTKRNIELLYDDENSAAVTISVSLPFSPKLTVDVDIVPAIYVQENNYKMACYVGKGDVFRRSYSHEETLLIRNSKGYHTMVYMIFKTIAKINKGSPLSNFDSYVFKNLLFWYQWNFSPKSLGTCFREMLYLLELCLLNGYLPSYFEPQSNLLKKFKKEEEEDDVCRKVGLQLKRIRLRNLVI